jgi:phosphohistidine phosphatase
MRLYLVRHGDAVSERVDATRPLSERGRAEIEAVADRAARLGWHPAEIFHSGITRARQTAEILARRLAPARGVRAMEGLEPEDDPHRLAAECEALRDAVMLVGHMPYMSRLASLLLLGETRRDVIRFGTGTIAGLARVDGRFLVEWVIAPHTEDAS